MNHANPVRIVLAGEYGTGNAGDMTRLQYLKSISNRDTEITVVGRPIHKRRDLLGVEFLPNLYHQTTPSRDRFFYGFNRGDSQSHLVDISSKITDSSLLVIGGGNLLLDLSFGHGYGLMAQYLEIARLGRMLGKPIWLFGVTIGPLLTQEGREGARLFLSLCDRVTVIDAASVAIAQDLGFSDVDLAVDTAAVLHRRLAVSCYEPLAHKNEKSLLVTLRDISFLPEVEKDRYIRKISDVLSYFIDSGYTEIAFLPHEDSSDFSDVDFIREIVDATHPAHLQNLKILPHSDDSEKMLSYYQRATAVITGRFHGVIFSMLAQTAFVAISHLPKVERILNDFGLSKNCLSPNQFVDMKTADIFLKITKMPESNSFLGGVMRYRSQCEADHSVYEETLRSLLRE